MAYRGYFRKFISASFAVLLILLLGCATASENKIYSKSDHFDGKHFFNPWGQNNTKSLFDLLKWKLSGKETPWLLEEGQFRAQSQIVYQGQAASIHVTFIGQATTYIQDQNHSILTDPHFTERASPFSFLGPKRHRAPGLKIDDLPSVNTVLVSHNHYDHMDIPSLVALDKKFKPQFLVPPGNAKYLREAGINKVIELDWWQSYENIQLVPAQHWSARGIMDRNEALWGGFVINLSGRQIYFAGDTGYGPHFKMIRERCGDMDLSLLPIGAYEPRYFMKDQHMNPQDAIQAHQDLNSKKSYAIHFETFQMTDEGFSEPRKALTEALKSAGLPSDVFFAPQLAETLIIH